MSEGKLPVGLMAAALDELAAAVSVTDAEGRLLYYNRLAGEILNRAPEMIGKDVRPLHMKEKSIALIDQMVADFPAGRMESYHYTAKRYGRNLDVTIAPLFEDGTFVGMVHTVVEIK